MDPEKLKIRLYRALSGKTQVEMAAEVGVDAATYGHYEAGLMKPGPDKLERAARVLGAGDEFGDEVLELLDLRRRKRLRAGRGIEDLLDEGAEELRAHMRRAYERLLTLPRPVPPPAEEDRLQAREQLPALLELTPGQRAAVLKLGDREYRAWALALEAGESALEAADPQEAARRASAALEFADLVEGPQGWSEAVRKRVLECQARVQERVGRL